MAGEYIIIGTSNSKLAGHADTIDSVLRAYKTGTIEKVRYHPTSDNPGQETLQYIDENHSDAKAIITGQMKGPINYKKRAIINDPEESITTVVKKYCDGEYDSEIEAQLAKEPDKKDNGDSEGTYGIPKEDGSGGGIRANKGRNPECKPGDYEVVGKGSGTKKGRASESNPKRPGYAISNKPHDDYSSRNNNDDDSDSDGSDDSSSSGSNDSDSGSSDS